VPNFSVPDEAFLRAAKEFQTPFHLYDEQGIRNTARALNEAFSWCEDFQEYFAVKALPNPTILRILKEEGCGTDCSSMTELMLSEAVGIVGRDIMFSANAYKSAADPGLKNAERAWRQVLWYSRLSIQ